MNLYHTLNILTKYNNGFFKSEAQKNLIISALDDNEGHIPNTFQEKWQMFAEYDDKGITGVYIHRCHKVAGWYKDYKWKRVHEDKLNSIELKQYKSMKTKFKKLMSKFEEHIVYSKTDEFKSLPVEHQEIFTANATRLYYTPAMFLKKEMEKLETRM